MLFLSTLVYFSLLCYKWWQPEQPHPVDMVEAQICLWHSCWMHHSYPGGISVSFCTWQCSWAHPALLGLSLEPVTHSCVCLQAGVLGDSVPSVRAWTLSGLSPSLAPSWSSPTHASPFLTVLNFLLYQYLALCGSPVEEHQKSSCTTAGVKEQNQGRSKHQQYSLCKNCVKGQSFL